jgi:hypothetical protein
MAMMRVLDRAHLQPARTEELDKLNDKRGLTAVLAAHDMDARRNWSR